MNYTVNIENMQFDPAVLTINAGDKVIWINKDAMIHTATRKDSPSSFDTGPLAKDVPSKEIEFNDKSGAAGFGYHCSPHPFMTAKIIVN